MKTFKLKTSLKCNNCVAKVSEQLDSAAEIESWSVDLKSPERIKTYEGNDAEAVCRVKKILSDARFTAEIYQ